MEYAWAEFASGRNAGGVFVKTVNRLKLLRQASGGKVKFNWDEPGGHWTYIPVAKLMLIEFASQRCGPEAPNRRHALRDRGDGSFQLIPSDNEIYNESTGHWTEGSIKHYNRNDIVMQKIAYPTSK